MKTIFETLITKVLMFALALCCVAASCDKYDDSNIWNAVNELMERVDALEKSVADNVTALQSIVSLGSISSCEIDTENGKIIITLLDGKKVEIEMKVTGNPLVSVIKDADGNYYWAVCKDGKTEYLLVDGAKVPVSVTPSFKLSEKNEWLISVDGGKTWVSTGIVQSSDEGTVFFKDVKIEGDYMILTLADGTTVKVAIIGEAEFKLAAEALWFSRTSMTKSAAIQMNNVKSYTITEKPEGWKAYIEESYLYVVSPEDFSAAPKTGEVKILALFDGGAQPEILAVPVSFEPTFSLTMDNELISVTMSEHTGDDFNGYILKAWVKSEYTLEKVLQWLNGDGAKTLPYSGSAKYAISDLVENYSSDEMYVVFGVPYLPENQVSQGNLSYTAEDVQTIEYSGASKVWSITDITYDYAHLKAVFSDVTEYYGGFFDKTAWDGGAAENVIDGIRFNRYQVCKQLTYDGPASGFPFNEYSYGLIPSTEYVIWMLPVNKTNRYALTDFIINTFTTKAIAKDASIAAPAATIDEITYSGFTATVTPAAGAAKTYSAIRPAVAIPENEQESVTDLIKLGDFSKGNEKNVVSTGDYDSSSELYLMSVSLTEDGRYGEVLKQKVEVKEPVFSDKLALSVKSFENGLGDVTLNLEFKGNPVSITYYAETFVFYDDMTIQKFLALDQMPGAKTENVSDLKDGKLNIQGLMVGSLYTFYAIVKDADDVFSYLYKYEFTPKVEVDYIMNTDADYQYGMPVLNGQFSDKQYVLNVEKPAECKKFWLLQGDSEYWTGDPWTDTDKMLTGFFAETTIHTSSVKNKIYSYMYDQSRFYIVWLDDKDRYHAIYEFNPYGAPAN